MSETHHHPHPPHMKAETRNWLLGIAGAIMTAAILSMASFLMFGLEQWVEKIASDVIANGGVSTEKIQKIEQDIAVIDAKLDNIDGDVGEVKEDLRNIVAILRGG